mmetsp:Transcript_28999/g.67810  ORF Transcript_28999/g.67810 Transcript_28999/m.67810 type:complete len:340 (-) Transcript_28999:76-1095(-)
MCSLIRPNSHLDRSAAVTVTELLIVLFVLEPKLVSESRIRRPSHDVCPLGLTAIVKSSPRVTSPLDVCELTVFSLQYHDNDTLNMRPLVLVDLLLDLPDLRVRHALAQRGELVLLDVLVHIVTLGGTVVDALLRHKLIKHPRPLATRLLCLCCFWSAVNLLLPCLVLPEYLPHLPLPQHVHQRQVGAHPVLLHPLLVALIHHFPHSGVIQFSKRVFPPKPNLYHARDKLVKGEHAVVQHTKLNLLLGLGAHIQIHARLLDLVRGDLARGLVVVEVKHSAKLPLLPLGHCRIHNDPPPRQPAPQSEPPLLPQLGAQMLLASVSSGTEGPGPTTASLRRAM